MVSSTEHAARLRLLRRALGMLEHEDGDLVFDQSPHVLDAINEIVLIIRKGTPVTEEDCLDYGLAAAAEMQVTCRNGVYRFSYKGSGEPVSLDFRDSTIPRVNQPRQKAL